jgi:hypothetical protein
MRTKKVTMITRKFTVYDENSNILLTSDSVDDIVDEFGVSISYIYAKKNTGEYISSDKGNIRITYTKTKITEVEPFVIPDDECQIIEDLPGEVWSGIPNIPDCNYVSNMGRFKVRDVVGNERFNTTFKSKNGSNKYYRDVVLVNPEGNNIRARASRIIAKTFIDPSFPIFGKKGANDLVVDHIDNDSTNDKASNLRIVTHSENLMAATYDQDTRAFGIPPKRVRCIETGKIYKSAAIASREMGFDYKQAVAHAANPNQTQKSANNFHWEYIEED